MKTKQYNYRIENNMIIFPTKKDFDEYTEWIIDSVIKRQEFIDWLKEWYYRWSKGTDFIVIIKEIQEKIKELESGK